MRIVDLIRDNEVAFSRYRHGIAYYSIRNPADGVHLSFPVPLADIGDATLLATDKAVMFMRYIRKAMDDGTLVPLADQT